MTQNGSNGRLKGRCLWFSATKGFGFLHADGAPEGQDCFCHFSALDMEGYKLLNEGDVVEFSIEIGPSGKEQAANVQKVNVTQPAHQG